MNPFARTLDRRGFLRTVVMTLAATDPWFQTLFADRIGGSQYGKGSEIYKFEKIKRAKRAALQAQGCWDEILKKYEVSLAPGHRIGFSR